MPGKLRAQEKSEYFLSGVRNFCIHAVNKKVLVCLLFSVIVSWCCGYTEKNAFGNIILLFLLFMTGRKNILSAVCVCCFLLFSAFYAPVGIIYGKINGSFIASLMQTNVTEAEEFIAGIPIIYFIISLMIVMFTVWFWRTRERNKKGVLFLLFFIALSVNAWPRRMAVEVVTGVAETRAEMIRYETLNNNQKSSWEIVSVEKKYKTIIIVIGESVRRDYLSVYGYPLPTTPWMNSALGIFINGYFSSAANTIDSLSRTLILDYAESGNPGNNMVTLASNADKKYFLKEGSFASRRTDDEDMLQFVREAVNSSSPKVIFVHMMGSHPNPCDRLFNDAEPFREIFGRKVSCYLSTLVKLDKFLQNIYEMVTARGEDFAMVYFSDHGLSVSSDSTPVHHAPGLRSGYDVPFVIMASDIVTHQNHDIHISARRFPEIFQWLTGIQTRNLPLISPLLQGNYTEYVSVFNGEHDVPIMTLPEEPLLTGKADSAF